MSPTASLILAERWRYSGASRLPARSGCESAPTPESKAVRKWLCLCCVLVASPAAFAQTRGISLEMVTGHAGYVDEVWDNRVLLGAALRVEIGSRVAVGPDVVYQHGFDRTTELIAGGTATVDLRGPAAARRVVPFLVVGAGVGRRRERFDRGPYTSGEFSASVGLGARWHAGRRWYVAGDARLGWEPERRLSVVLGWRART